MDALLWAVVILSLAALGLLALVSPRHAREALRTVAVFGLWITATLVALPLLLVRS